MATQVIGTTTWEEVTTTTVETVFQNQSNNPMYLTTEDTSGLNFNEGYYLTPEGGAIVLDAGVTVSAVAFRSDSVLFYMGIQ